ncbi:MAG: hypothetical protein ABF629_15765 [Sporolactobacillus sp.]|uniref:hypothetical protein n=1 Tax=Sporolactobacillus sp. STSJ-5 TaxID=2965076 RepID=UPI002105CD23|nr:hypothetical protein [Sporolactobacillus sp. STSJ-5]MCQ2010980.1 hypothetical protein [Sporolactobacillus sp. STSJ-5]
MIETQTKTYYTHETSDGNIALDVKQLETDLNGKSAKLTIYVLGTEGNNYIAKLELNKNNHGH